MYSREFPLAGPIGRTQQENSMDTVMVHFVIFAQLSNYFVVSPSYCALRLMKPSMVSFHKAQIYASFSCAKFL